MSFHEIRFPTDLSFGALGGPERRTEIVTLSNGFEERNSPWAGSRRKYDAGIAMRSLKDIEDVIAFFEARQGQLYGFRWKDWSDFKSCPANEAPEATDQVIGLGDGLTRLFQLQKAYRSGSERIFREIKKPVSSTVKIAIQGTLQDANTQYTLDDSTGEITFAMAPADGLEITAGFEFDVPVRFDTAGIQVNLATFNAGDVPSIPVIEVRV